MQWLSAQFGSSSLIVGVIWILLGAGFLWLETRKFPGVGLLFAGLAAIITGLAIEAGLVGAHIFVAQLAFFLTLTTAFAVVLWRKISGRIGRKLSLDAQGLVGAQAIIMHAGLQKKAKGTVRIAGHYYSAMLDSTEPAQSLSKGTLVTITAVQDGIVYIKQA